MSTEPSEKDAKLATATHESISGLIETAFYVNRAIPPMPPYPAIPLKRLKEVIARAETLMQMSISCAKALKKHAEAKGIDPGPLVGMLATLDVSEVRLHYGKE